MKAINTDRNSSHSHTGAAQTLTMLYPCVPNPICMINAIVSSRVSFGSRRHSSATKHWVSTAEYERGLLLILRGNVCLERSGQFDVCAYYPLLRTEITSPTRVFIFESKPPQRITSHFYYTVPLASDNQCLV